MKKTILLLILCLLLCVGCLGQNQQFSPKYVKQIDFTDSIIYQVSFYSKNNIAVFESFKYGIDSSLFRAGYQYNFHNNGRLKQISYYRNGVKSDFELLFDKRGKCYSIRDFVNDIDVLQVIEESVLALARNDHQVNYYHLMYFENALTIEYDSTTGEIWDIYIHSSKKAVTYSQKNGIYLYFNKKRVSFTKNYSWGEEYGESIYFKRGKPFMIVISDLNAMGKGVKIKDFYDYEF